MTRYIGTSLKALQSNGFIAMLCGADPPFVVGPRIYLMLLRYYNVDGIVDEEIHFISGGDIRAVGVSLNRIKDSKSVGRTIIQKII